MQLPDMSAPEAALRVCIDSTLGGTISGFFCGERLLEPVVFADADDFLLQIDALLDVQNAPQAFQQGRSFGQHLWEVPAACGEEPGMTHGQVAKAQGKRLTASVSILSRRNATWQGTVDFLDGTQPRRFSSALELLRQIWGSLV